MTHYIFIYGTLLPGLRLHPHMRTGSMIAAAQCHAYLYDLGEYPGMVRSVLGDPSCVKGEVYTVDESLLNQLDELEGVVSGDDAASLYLRQRILLEKPAELKSVEVWSYFYNRPVQGCPRVHSGDYKAYLRGKS